MTGGRFTVSAIFRAIDRVTRPVRQMQDSVRRMTRTMSASIHGLDQGLDRLARGAKRVGMAFVAAGTLGSVAFADMSRTGMEFEQSMTAAASRMSLDFTKGTKQYRALEAEVRSLGRTTEFTSSQVAVGLNKLAASGVTVEEAIAGLPRLTDFATAHLWDLGEAGQIALKTMGSFRLPRDTPEQFAESLSKTMDVMTAAVNKSQIVDISDMFEALKQGAPIAITTGQSIETIAAMTGAMADGAIDATRAATAMKNIFLSLAAPDPTAQILLDRILGVQFFDKEAGKYKDAIDVFEELQTALEKQPAERHAMILERIFGKIPIAAADILRVNVDRMRELREEIERMSTVSEDFKGVTAALAAIMRGTTLNSFRELVSAWESLKISIFDEIQAPLQTAIEKTTDYVRANEEMIASRVGEWLVYIIDNFEDLVSQAANIAKLVVVVYALVTALKAVSIVLGIINALAVMNPIGLIIVAVMAFIAALAAALIWCEEITDWFMNLGPLGKIFAAILGGPVLAFAVVADFILEKWEPVKKFFKGLLAHLADMADLITAIATVGFFGEFNNPFDGRKYFGPDGPVEPAQAEGVASRIERGRDGEDAFATIKIEDDTGKARLETTRHNNRMKMFLSGGM